MLNLAGNTDVKITVAGTGGLKAVVEAMQCHPKSAGVQEAMLSAEEPDNITSVVWKGYLWCWRRCGVTPGQQECKMLEVQP